MEDKEILMHKIANIVCEYYGQDIKMLKHSSRVGEIAIMKHVFRYLCIDMGYASIPMISRHSGINRATVYHSIEACKGLLKYDKMVNQDVKAIKLLLNERIKLESVVFDVKRLKPEQLDKLQEYLIAI